jgi:hypothetical protein
MTKIMPGSDCPTTDEARRRALLAAEFAEPAAPGQPAEQAAAAETLPMRRIAAGEFGAW